MACSPRCTEPGVASGTILAAVLDCVVVGPGGIGGHLTGRLLRGGAAVAVVARGEHGAAITRDGLSVSDPQDGAEPLVVHPQVAADLAEAPPARALVLATKARDLPALAEALPAWLDRAPHDALVVALQNGVAHLDGPLRRAAAGRFVAGSVYIFSAVTAPGRVVVTGGPRWYRLGPVPADPALQRRVAALVEEWRSRGVTADAEADGRRVVWEKLCVLAPLAALTALTERTVGELRSLDEALRTFRTLVEEIAAVGRAEGVSIDEDMPERCEAGLRATDAAGRSSLFLDLSRGRPSEVEDLLGDPLRRAESHDVATPVLRTVYAALRVRHGLAAPA